MRNLKAAFSMVEVVVMLAIVALAVSVVMVGFGKVNSKQALEGSALLVTSILNEARAMTLSSVEASQYGVYLSDSAVTLFIGSTYSAGADGNVVTSLNPLTGISQVSLSGGGSSVVFNRLTGATAQPGSFRVYLRSATTTYRTVTINSTGVIEEN